MIRVQSHSIRITSRPRIGAVVRATNPDYAQFDVQTAMEAVADVVLTGDASDPGRGWAIGFMQAMTFVHWAIYRGATAKEGSILRQQGRMPVNQATACFDARFAGTTFMLPDGHAPIPSVAGVGTMRNAVLLPERPVFPFKARVIAQDQPEGYERYVENNTRTGQANLLNEARLQMNLCAALALRDPSGKVQLLGGFLWSVGWHTKFRLDVATRSVPAMPILPGTRATIGEVFAGPPRDPHFANVLAGPRTSLCNTELNRTVDESVEGWPQFNVQR